MEYYMIIVYQWNWRRFYRPATRPTVLYGSKFWL